MSDDPAVDTRMEALAENLRGIHAAANVAVPDAAAKRAVRISVKLPIDELTNRVTELLAYPDGSQGLYRWQDEPVIVNARTGQLKRMKAASFRTWLPTKNVVLTDGEVKQLNLSTQEIEMIPKKGSLTGDQAETILASETLLAHLPEITGVNPVKMPVFSIRERDERGNPKLRLLKPGYDQETGIYTMQNGMDYAEDVPVDVGVESLHNTFRFFGWRSEPRDLAIYLAYAFTMFGRGLYLGKAPMLVLNANIQESGKSILMEWLTRLIWGTAATKPLLEDEDAALESFLNSSAMANLPYTVFDNVDWKGKVIHSPVIDDYLTQSSRNIRKLGGNEMANPLVRAVTIMTGNKLTLSPDLARRSLIADLWNPLSGAERGLPKGAVMMDERFLSDRTRRADAMSWLWAVLREWDLAGRPERPATRKIGSFTGWSEVFPHVVWHAGQTFDRDWNCMAESTNEEIGDKAGMEYKRLANMALIECGKDEDGAMRETFEITVAQLAGVFRRNVIAPPFNPLYPESDVDAVLQTEDQKGGWKYKKGPDEPINDMLGDSEAREVERRRQASEWLNNSTASKFGNAVKRELNEKYFAGPDGNFYLFLQRKGVTPARYLVSRVAR